MSRIDLLGFRGSNQAANPRLLNEAVGVNAVNLEPGRNDFRPLRDLLTVATVPSSPQALTIYRMGRDVVSDSLYWLSWSTAVSVARGFDGDDTTERTYFTGSGTPKFTSNAIGLGSAPYPQATREFGVPAPISAPTITLDTDGPDGTASTVFYVHTFVNDLGWESAPSPPNAGISIKPGAIVDITDLEAAPAGNYGITLRRIYRTQADATGAAEFFFLREIAIGTTSTEDDARKLGETLATVGYLPLPAAAFGLIALWNGMFGALAGRRALVSEAGAIYAFKADNDIPVVDTPVASAKWEQNWLVLTTGRPVLIQGQDPIGMSDTPLAIAAPCVSARSVVAFAHGVVWASNEGLAYAGNSGQMMLTEPSAAAPEGVLTPRQWKALVPSTMVAGRWGRFYACSYNDGSGLKGFLFDPLNPGGGITYLSFGWNACWYDELADQLFVLVGGNVRKFAGANTFLTGDFTSKRFVQTRPLNYSHAKVVASAYPLTVTFTARIRDPLTGVETTHTEARTIDGDRAFTLKRGFLADDWQIRVQGSSPVEAVRLATNIKLLKGA